LGVGAADIDGTAGAGEGKEASTTPAVCPISSVVGSGDVSGFAGCASHEGLGSLTTPGVKFASIKERGWIQQAVLAQRCLLYVPLLAPP
jgi:hypothetical protein